MWLLFTMIAQTVQEAPPTDDKVFPAWLALIGVVIAAFIGIAGTIFATRGNKMGQREQGYMNIMHEELDRMHEKNNIQEEKHQALANKVLADKKATDQAIYDLEQDRNKHKGAIGLLFNYCHSMENYNIMLVNHINMGYGPPAPENPFSSTIVDLNQLRKDLGF